MVASRMITVVIVFSMIIALPMQFSQEADSNEIDSDKKHMLDHVAAEDVMCKAGLPLMICSSGIAAYIKLSSIMSEKSWKEKAGGEHSTQENILTVKVIERKTKSPVSDATVIIIAKSGKIIVWKITDKNGTQQLDVPSGDYYMMIKASCCYSKMDHLHIRGDMEKIFELADR